jgi:hypothetical protein
MDAARCAGGVSVSAWGVRNSEVFGTDNGRRTPVNLSWAAVRRHAHTALALGLLYLSHPTFATHVGNSPSCRYCCKSPKLPGANFLAVKKSDRRPRIDVASITLPRSPAIYLHAMRSPTSLHENRVVQPKEILITKTASHANLRRPLNILCASNAPASGQNEGAPEGNRSAPQFQGQSLRQRPWSVRPPAPCRNSRSGSPEASSPLGPRARGQRAGARLLNRRT